MTDDAVAQYLREVEQQLAGLPPLQRREVLADVRAHILTERLERAAEILERLGSPAEVAAAGTRRTTIRPAEVGVPTRSRLLGGAAVVAVIIFGLLVTVSLLSR